MKNYGISKLPFFVGMLIGFLILFQTASFGQIELVGVNLACAEFGGEIPGTFNKTYTYPKTSEVDYFVSKGMNVFRLPFKWERLQGEAEGDFVAAELARIKSFVTYATASNAYTILDPHNYARYYSVVIGSENLPISAFEDFWRKLATEFKDNDHVIFGLMNEPNGMTTELWLNDANAAIAAIRRTGATNLILVPGNGYTGAHSWNASYYGTPNGKVMLGIVDSLDNHAFEAHQYFDSNSSGGSSACVSTTVGSARLRDFTNWLRDNGKRGFLGEFGVGTNDTCLEALDNMLDFVDENADVWMGWTYWAAGPWWGEYMFTVEPKNGEDRAQMAMLEKHIPNTGVHEQAFRENANSIAILKNCPNPVKKSTQIEFELLDADDVELTIFDAAGHTIAKLVDHFMIAGHHSVAWNATNSNGEPLASGVYFYVIQLRQLKQTAVRSLLVLK